MDFKVEYRECTYEEFLAIAPMKRIKPKSPSFVLRTLAAILSTKNLRKTSPKLKLEKKRGGVVLADEIGLPVSQTGGVLPCGASARWTAK